MYHDDLRLVMTTCAPDQAERLLRALLEERLVACGNILPGVRSHYWWQGAICSDEEALVVMETPSGRADAAMKRLAELHPYEVPKILGFSADAVHAPYLAWARAVTSG